MLSVVYCCKLSVQFLPNIHFANILKTSEKEESLLSFFTASANIFEVYLKFTKNERKEVKSH